MSFAFLPFYTGDYLRDTRHLSMMEHGAYLMFLTYCWDQRAPIPLDDRKQIGIVNARSKEEIEAMRAVLREFFVAMDDGWYNRRMQREIEKAEAISGKRKAAGRKGFQAKAKHLLSKSIARASTLTLTPIPQLKSTSTTLSGKPDLEPVLLQAREVLDYLNANTGRSYRPVEANLRLIAARLQSGASAKELKEVVFAKCHEWLDDPTMARFLRPKTLFNATNFENYLGEFQPRQERLA